MLEFKGKQENELTRKQINPKIAMTELLRSTQTSAKDSASV